MTRAPKDVRALLTSLISQASEVGATVSRISRRLHPPTLQYLGLSGAVSTFCAEVSASQPIQVECLQEDVPADLRFDIALNLFRIVQEAVANVVKHSRAGRCAVILRGDTTGLHLEIIDNGCGFDLMETPCELGLGLISMRERCGQIKATLTVESEPGRGTSVRVRLPLQRVRANVRHETARKVQRKTHNMTLGPRPA
jgi:two-component system sensor histidine kinase UhpB